MCYQGNTQKIRTTYFLALLLTIFVVSGCTADNENLTKEADIAVQQKQNEELTNNPDKHAPEVEPPSQMEKSTSESYRDQEALDSSLGLEAVTVSRVIDGDTFVLSDGRKIRLIGVNTPESTNRHEKYGKEASHYTSSKLTGKQVWIGKDVSDTDRYNRYLRIVWLEIPADDMNENEIRTKMFNADLVLNGYAEPSTFPPDVKYSDYFKQFAREAREKNMGLWAFGKDGTTRGDLDSENTDSNHKSNSTTKQNENKKSTSANLLYDPNGPDRDCGDFNTQAEAQAFFEASGPGDPHRLDGRDQDGVVCESLP